MRLIEPASKLRTIFLLRRYFAVAYSERTVYRALHEMAKRKGDVEKIAVAFAKEKLSSNLALVLYDVTTLYFETFEKDELRVPGFSKDNKSQQPQIVVGLLVTREGFPLGYEVFKGNTFEGHTMLPVLEQFASVHGVSTPTVVADAAMISRDNVAKLKERGLSYIVGARLANAPPRIIEKISAALGEKDGAMTRSATDHGDLVCDFSAKRYRKDKVEAEKQIAKAEALVAKGEPGKRAKFVVKEDDKEAYMLNDALIAKAKLLFGVKGYYTNIPEDTLSNKEVVARYHDLWNVEASFRMAKHDLSTRPIFHRKEDAIRAHMVICFVALALGKSIELATGLSLRRFIDALWSVTDARIVDTTTEKEFMLRSPVDNAMKSMLKKLGLSY
jgi:transposase